LLLTSTDRHRPPRIRSCCCCCSGAAYVYKRTGTSWAQQAYVKAANNDAGDDFGTSVALDGNTLAVGAKDEASNQTTITNGTTASSDDSNTQSGAVYVYRVQ